MKRYFASFLIVMLCYGIGLHSPAASAKAQQLDYESVRQYVNGKERKSIRELFQKFEKNVPSKMFEEAMKETKGKNALAWFDGVKMGPNYAYMRVGKVKLLARAVTEKNGERVVYLNGKRITLDDFRDYKVVQGKIFGAYFKEATTKKGLFSKLITPAAFAGPTAEVGNGKPAGQDASTNNGAIVTDQCLTLYVSVAQLAQEGGQNGRQICRERYEHYKQTCCQPGSSNECEADPCGGAAAGGDNNMMWILLGLGAAALLLFLLMKKDKKDKPVTPTPPPPGEEVPEDEDGVGGRPPIMCQGAEANCGGNTTYPDPPTYTTPSESTGTSSSDPYPDTGSNNNLDSTNETATGVGRGQKTRARVKTK